MPKKRSSNTPARASRWRAELAEGPEADSLFDEEDWQVFTDPAVICKDPDALARLLFRLKAAIESGPDGIEQARATLIDGIWRALKQSGTQQAVIKLYGAYLSGRLKPEDEPARLVDAVILRAQDDAAHSLVPGR